MKSPKDVQRERVTFPEYLPYLMWGVIVLMLVVAAYNLFVPRSNASLSREAYEFMSTVQPGDTLYWFSGGRVRALVVTRNHVRQQSVEVNSDVNGIWTVYLADGAKERREYNGREFYSYNEVYYALVTTRENRK